MNNETEKKIMSQNIKKQIELRDMNVKDLSRALDLPYTTVISWVNMTKYPRIDKIEKMATLFGCAKSDLIEDKTELTIYKGQLLELIDGMTEEELKRLIKIIRAMLEE